MILYGSVSQGGGGGVGKIFAGYVPPASQEPLPYITLFCDQL